MFIQLSLIVVVLLLAYASFTWYFRPKKIQKWYKQQLEKLGYKVYEHPFKFLGSPIYNGFKQYTEKYGDAMYLQKHVYPGYDVILHNVINYNCITFINPALIKEVLGNDKVFVYQKINFVFEIMKTIGGEGLFFSEGVRWKRKRKIMSKLFNFDFFMSRLNQMNKITDQTFQSLQKKSENKNDYNSKNGEIECDLIEVASIIFGNIFATCFLGARNLDEKINGISTHLFFFNLAKDSYDASTHFMVLILGKWLYRMGLTRQFRKLKKNMEIAKRFSREFIRSETKSINERGPKENAETIFETLLFLKEQDKSFGYDQNQLVDQFITFMIAGQDVSSNLLIMMVDQVVKNPAVEQKARECISNHIKEDSDLTYENIKKLVYIDWIIEETLRISGPTTQGVFLREALSDHYIKDVPITKGMGVKFQPMANHYDSRHYKNPFEFRPERWESQCANIDSYLHLAFSGGPRSCIGKQLGLMQTKLVFVKMLMRYKKIKVPSSRIMEMRMVYNPKDSSVILLKSKEY